MKKKIILSVFIALLLISSIFQTMAIATEEGIEDPAEELEDDILSTIYFETKDIEEKNFYSSKEDVVLDGKIINGNAFMVATNVTLKDITINGDVFIVANKVVFESESALNGNVFVCASNLEINGQITRELYAAANNIIFKSDAIVIYEAKMVAEHIELDGAFDRDVKLYATELKINEKTMILGKLDYMADQEATIPNKALIKDVNFSKKMEKEEKVIDMISNKVFDFARYFILTMVVFLILMKFMPVTLKKVENSLSVSSFGIGILSLILIPVLVILLLISYIAMTLGFALLALLVLIMLVSMAVSNISIASLVSKKVEKMKLPISVSVVTLITWILLQIPYVGIVVAFILFTTGLGISVRNVFKKTEKNDEKGIEVAAKNEKKTKKAEKSDE